MYCPIQTSYNPGRWIVAAIPIRACFWSAAGALTGGIATQPKTAGEGTKRGTCTRRRTNGRGRCTIVENAQDLSCVEKHSPISHPSLPGEELVNNSETPTGA